MSTDAKVLLGIMGFTALIIAGIAVFSSRGADSPQEANVVAPENMERLVRPDSQKIAVVNAPVTLVEFADFECEACRAAYPTVKRV
jgi:protein-disulfide isomerase